MNQELLELFEGIRTDYGSLTVDEFTAKYQSEGGRFNLSGLLIEMPQLRQLWKQLVRTSGDICNNSLPIALRRTRLETFKSVLDQIVGLIKSGSLEIPTRRLSDQVVNQIVDNKVRQICLEINNTPETNVLQLLDSFGEAVKWTLFFRSKQVGSSLTERTGLKDLLDEAISKPYYTDNAAMRFLQTFQSNFGKSSYDMVRHSERFIPNIQDINPNTAFLEDLLKVTFPPQP